MKLDGFSIADDFIALQRGAERFDLHNCFDFAGLSFDPVGQALQFRWRRGSGEWVKPTEPDELSLSFAGVYLFKAAERDPELPFSEDSCVDSIGFIWDALVGEMRAFTSNQPSDGCTHLAVNFMSGLSFKVGAATVALHVSGGA